MPLPRRAALGSGVRSEFHPGPAQRTAEGTRRPGNLPWKINDHNNRRSRRPPPGPFTTEERALTEQGSTRPPTAEQSGLQHLTGTRP